VLLTHLQSPLNDLAHTERVLLLDSKNYHVWSHRQWLLTAFGLFHTATRNELDFVDKLLTADVRNNRCVAGPLDSVCVACNLQ
jgi:hypothetical protein